MSKDVSNVPSYLKKYMDDASKSGFSDSETMAAANVSVPRISLKGKKFQFINGDDESKKTSDVIVIILAVDPEGSRMIKTFYADGYNPNDTSPPDCTSSNGFKPDLWVQNPVHGNCSSCPKNIFGSATNSSGKKTKACRDAKRLWVVKADDVDGVVYGLNIPVTSLKNMALYGKEIRATRAPLASVMTRLSMDDELEFPMVGFESVGFLNEEFGNKAIARNESRDWLAGQDSRDVVQSIQKQAALESKDSDIIDVEPSKASTASVDEVANNW